MKINHENFYVKEFQGNPFISYQGRLHYYQATLRNKFGGEEVESKLRSLDVYQKRKGEWIQRSH